ncbi:MAG TPA: lysylphosphatidylglycerol synthase transmembrane domain-containing protein [Polyangiales bacterium]|nr:lysylphosphatidylglycerol synthase transmembrane domain-containing protein [Polyangiales bacterium]
MKGGSNWLRFLVRLTGPALLILVIWSLDDRAALWEAVRHASWPPLAAAIALIIPVIHLKVARWRGLLAARGFAYPLRRTYAAVLPSLYLGMLTPGRVGDALRIQYVHREIDVPYSDGLATTLMDRFSDLYVVALVAAFGLVHFASILRGDLAQATWVAVAVALIAPLLLMVRGPADLFGWVLRRLTDRWHESYRNVLRSMRSLVWKGLTLAIPLTAAAFAINYVQGWLIARAIGVDLSYLDVASLLSATSLLGLMPISIAGVGVRELFLALVFPALGLPAAQGVAFGLLIFVCINLSTVLVGFVAWQIAPPPVGASEPDASF